MFGNKSNFVTKAYERPKRAKITVDVDLVTGQASMACNVQLPALMMAHILTTTVSGLLLELQRMEAMVVGKNNGIIGSGPGAENPNAEMVKNLEVRAEMGEANGKKG